jgi:hypothetical protein
LPAGVVDAGDDLGEGFLEVGGVEEIGDLDDRERARGHDGGGVEVGGVERGDEEGGAGGEAGVN